MNSSKLMSFVFVAGMGLLFASPSVQANELRGIVRNNDGVTQFQQKNSARAIDKFTSALGDLPFSPEVHFNIGNGFLVRGEFEKAMSEFQQVIKNAPGDSAREHEIRYLAHFNQAVAYTELKKVDEALQEYQKALDDKPDSVEAKTNIELLIQQQGGGGEGGDDKNQNKDDQKDKKDPKDQKESKDQKYENPKPTPRPFKSEEMSQQDVKRILEELKRQEEQIRARLQNEQRRDAPAEKDW